MKHLSTAFLAIVLAIAVYQGGGVTAQDDSRVDQVAEEAKNRALTIVDGPKYVSTIQPALIEPSQPSSTNITTQSNVQTPKPQQRPPSKPPLILDKPPHVTDKLPKPYLIDYPRHYYGHMANLPPNHRSYPRPVKLHKNSVYNNFPPVIPLPPHKNHFYVPRPIRVVSASSTSNPSIIKSPKFSLPTQTINGIRSEFVRPPKAVNTTTTTTTSTTTETTTSTTTTTRALRTKRIWPKRMTDTQKSNLTLHNTTITKDNSITKTDEYDLSASNTRVRVISRQKISTTPTPPPTKRSYRPVTRTPKIKYTTASSDLNFTHISPNDWIPIVPSHYPTQKIRGGKQTPISRRSDGYFSDHIPSQMPVPGNQMMYLQSFRLLPVQPTQIAETTPALARKNMVFFKKKHHQLYPHNSGYSTIKAHSPVSYVPAIDELELQTEASHPHPRVLTKIKHHHHHHHHKYVKTVEKKVPYKVEVPKPYLVPVEKKVNVPVEKIKYVDKPYPVTVEKRVPYPIGIKVPQPVPVKVVEKEYVPKPYPIVHHVPVVKHVQVKVPQPVPYAVEKRVPYPVEVKVPVHVDRPVPVPVQVEKRVPYPVPVRVFVPQPYAVETKVPYRVAVKEPVEVIKHVPVRVPVPQPFAVKVPHPVPVPYEKRVPYPVEVEKKVPVPYEIIVPERVEVEKKVPVYIPKPYPVEKRVPYPVRVPFPVRVPVKVPVEVPVEVPIYIHSPLIYEGQAEYMTYENNASTAHSVTSTPDHNTVTVHGNGAFSLIQSRADTDTDTNSVSTTSSPQS